MESEDPEAIARIEKSLSGAAHPIQVCRWLISHRDRLSIDEWDPLMRGIRGVVSETDDFDVDEAQRARWNPEALARKDIELAAYLDRCGGMRGELGELLARLRAAVGRRGRTLGDAPLPARLEVADAVSCTHGSRDRRRLRHRAVDRRLPRASRTRSPAGSSATAGASSRGR
jgi:hypothetical protein